jgi:hypothetical protein
MCGSCGRPSGGYTPPPRSAQMQSTQIVSDSSCNITLDQLFFWKAKLECVKANNWAPLISSTTPQINVYLGWIVSAINFYATSPCYFSGYLSQIVPVINLVLNNTSC